MRPDELKQPLRQRSWRERIKSLMPSALQVTSTLTVLAGAGAITWALTAGVPMTGEPVVRMKLKPVDPMTTATVTPVEEDPEPEDEDELADDPNPPDRIEIIRPSGQVTTVPGPAVRDRQAAFIAPQVKSLARAPIRSVTQKGPLGLLPKIAKNGKRPSDVYARPVPIGQLQASIPKIAILLGGMGLNTSLTGRAIKELPGEVTFAFAPYGNGLQKQINQARVAGHEIMLHLPMEPFGYPSVNPGPRTLLASAPSAENMRNLHWHMSRFSGYIGITNYLGAKFASEGEAIAPVLRELNARGLVFLENGAADQSMAEAIGQVIDLQVRQTHAVIDSQLSFAAISEALHGLEKTAREQGRVIGFGTSLAVTIEAVAKWAEGLPERGVMLVPVSAMYKPAAG